MKITTKYRDSNGQLHQKGADVSNIPEGDLEFLKKNNHIAAKADGEDDSVSEETTDAAKSKGRGKKTK